MDSMPSTGATTGLRREHLAANHDGRDLVVGDLHGCRFLLDRALDALAFDPGRDRMLSVGDLVDRGPDSRGCLALLEEPWFHAIMGNHEDMMARRVAGEPGMALLHLQNGGEWLRGLEQLADDPRLVRQIRAAARLPHLLTVGDGIERYHLVHAELPAGTTTVMTDAELDAGPAMDPHALLWTRELMLGAADGIPERYPGLSTTYCGHTPHPEVRRRRSHVCLDTGAVFAAMTGDDTTGALTVAERRGGREVALHRFGP